MPPPSRRALSRVAVGTSPTISPKVPSLTPSNEPPKKEKLSDVIFVKIDDTGQIFVRDRLTDVRAIHANIVSALAQKPDASVVVASARDADVGILVRVVDQARVAGAKQVSLVALVE